MKLYSYYDKLVCKSFFFYEEKSFFTLEVKNGTPKSSKQPSKSLLRTLKHKLN